MKSFPEPDEAALEILLGQAADEFTKQLRQGRQPDMGDFLRRYPAIADILQTMLPALQVMSTCVGEAAEAPNRNGGKRQQGRNGFGE